MEERICEFDREINKALSGREEKLVPLQTIPGIDQSSACAVVTEIGV